MCVALGDVEDGALRVEEVDLISDQEDLTVYVWNRVAVQ